MNVSFEVFPIVSHYLERRNELQNVISTICNTFREFDDDGALVNDVPPVCKRFIAFIDKEINSLTAETISKLREFEVNAILEELLTHLQ